MSDAESLKIQIIQNDEIAKKLVAVWSNVKKMYHNENGVWDTSFSLNEWCNFAGLPAVSYNFDKCEQLYNLKIVLPDGRIHHWIQQFLTRPEE